ncbi:hypothetical protein ACFQRK_22870 [Parapedobacter sp. GCM10030251]|uniref:hypothetical protein n=1 Tax=Parapedobacter sp. GCM10030251 TaxID=3273419 RepID=UPI0036149539
MRSKVTDFIKQYFFLLALVATFIGFSAFKLAERYDEPEDGWYEVTITGSPATDPANQQIGNMIPEPPLSDSTSCAQSNLHDICAVELEFDRSDPNNELEKPQTVQDALDDELVDVADDARQPQAQ